ncbi:hypothetical protein ACIPPS_08400 [Streptomyces sp. NPDC090127]|uniref:hypothetical protein n=1 Tax=Streptomyces sp. NPDC090127 TaxID=3365953 RepID=UPI0037F34E55
MNTWLAHTRILGSFAVVTVRPPSYASPTSAYVALLMPALARVPPGVDFLVLDMEQVSVTDSAGVLAPVRAWTERHRVSLLCVPPDDAVLYVPAAAVDDSARSALSRALGTRVAAQRATGIYQALRAEPAG